VQIKLFRNDRNCFIEILAVALISNSRALRLLSVSVQLIARQLMAIRTRLSVLLLAIQASIGVYADSPTLNLSVDDPEVSACIARMFPDHSMTQTVSLASLDATGVADNSQAELAWKRFDDGRSHALLRVTDPPGRAGMGVLVAENPGRDPDLWVYLPELRQARRVTGQAFGGSMFGTDFSYEDFTSFQGVALSGITTRIDDQDVDGVGAYKFETIPTDVSSKYSRLLTYIDSHRCVLMRIDFYGKNGILQKELNIAPDEVRAIEERWIPMRMVMHDRIQDSKTELRVLRSAGYIKSVTSSRR